MKRRAAHALRAADAVARPDRGLPAGRVRRAWVTLACATLLAACGDRSPDATPAAPTAAASYVGGAACTACHAQEAALWQGSHHDRAMQPATVETVLGDFGGVTAEHGGAEWTFYRMDGEFRVRAPAANGATEELTVTHTYGVEPLQQYLVPRPGGRLQGLAAHEIGHTLGLDHTDVTTALMCGGSDQCYWADPDGDGMAPITRLPKLDDIAGIQYLYSPAPVPEPHTWALLLAGLGLVGIAYRRRPSLR